MFSPPQMTLCFHPFTNFAAGEAEKFHGGRIGQKGKKGQK
jgi:hypothetical protein